MKFCPSITAALGLALFATTAAIASSSPPEPTRTELLAEIQFLRNRLATLEASVIALISDPASSAHPTLPATSSTPNAVASIAAVAAPATHPKEQLLSFYGYLKIDGFYESQDTYTDAIPFWVCPDMPNGQNSDGEFGITAKESRFGVKIKGPQLGDGVLRGQLEFDFYGNTALNSHHAYSPRTRHAYVEWQSPTWTLLAGETWETFLITFPKTVNFASYNMQGQLGLRRTQMRISRKLELGDGQLNLHLALAEPLAGVHGADLDGDQQDDGADAEMPFVEAKITYQQGKILLGFSGFYGQEELAMNGPASARTYDAWALILGGTVPLYRDQLSLRGSLWTGSNVDSAWGGIGQGINLVQSRTIDATGGWVQVNWAPSSKLEFNIGLSRDDPRDSHLEANQRTFNESALLNTFYHFNPNLTVGLEWLYLRTGYKASTTAGSQRVQSMVKYNF